MTYLQYVVGAYAVFAAVLAWDYALPRWRLAQVRRRIAARGRREAARTQQTQGTPDA